MVTTRVFRLLLIGTLLTCIWMLASDSKWAHDGPKFTELQNAKKKDDANKVLKGWSDRDRRWVTMAMIADMVFAVCYLLLIAASCLRASQNAHTRWVIVAGLLFAAGAVLGGLCDLIENATMLVMLSGTATDFLVTVMSSMQVPKFLLPVLAAFYGLFAHFDV